MALVTVAIVAVVTTLLWKIPVSPNAALHVAGAAGRLRVFDFAPSLTNTYTFWSGVIGGTFLMLSYFGTDQSQVQRYLTARSIDEARNSLLISAYWKIPLQAMILLIGVLVFVFYTFERPPMLFNPAHAHRAQQAAPAAYGALEARFDAAFGARRALPERLQGGDGVLGPLRLRRRDVRGHVGLAHRGREPLRLVLLRLDPRRVPARDDPVGRRVRRVRRADRRHDGRGIGRALG